MTRPRRPILVVDDEEVNVRFLQAILEEAGYQIVSTTDPEQAVPMVAREKPCLILLDLNMPGLDGLQVLEQVKRVTSIPVIMLTGLDSSEKAVAALRGGAYDYITRPVDFKKLLRTIELALATQAEEEDKPRISQYELMNELGRGGMGIVYEARDTLLERTVAIKVLLPELAFDPQFETRLLREARAVAKLSHPGIVSVFEAGRHRGRLFIAMELLKGTSLKDRFESGPRLSPGEAVNFGCQAAEALSVAHQAGLIHRDIKPSNIMLVGDGQVKIVDFGLVRAPVKASEAITLDRSFKGTPAYASPEQIQGCDIDGRTDIYSLGIVLYELLLGERAFDESNVFALALHVVKGELAKPVREAAGIPPPLVAVLEQMMAPDVDRRPADMKEVACLLQKAEEKIG